MYQQAAQAIGVGLWLAAVSWVLMLHLSRLRGRSLALRKRRRRVGELLHAGSCESLRFHPHPNPPPQAGRGGAAPARAAASGHVLIQNLYRVVEANGYQSRHAAFGHGDAEQPVHPRHGDRLWVMIRSACRSRGHSCSRSQKRSTLWSSTARPLRPARRSAPGGDEHREEQRQRGQGLLAAGQQRQGCGFCRGVWPRSRPAPADRRSRSGARRPRRRRTAP